MRSGHVHPRQGGFKRFYKYVSEFGGLLVGKPKQLRLLGKVLLVTGVPDVINIYAGESAAFRMLLHNGIYLN